MKIGHPADKLPPVATVGTTATAEAGKSAAAAQAAQAAATTADPSTRVELSSTAATLLSGGSSAEFDADKVGRMADAIAAGTFKVDAEAIADRLIANAQELLSKGRG